MGNLDVFNRYMPDSVKITPLPQALNLYSSTTQDVQPLSNGGFGAMQYLQGKAFETVTATYPGKMIALRPGDLVQLFQRREIFSVMEVGFEFQSSRQSFFTKLVMRREVRLGQDSAIASAAQQQESAFRNTYQGEIPTDMMDDQYGFKQELLGTYEPELERRTREAAQLVAEQGDQRYPEAKKSDQLRAAIDFAAGVGDDTTVIGQFTIDDNGIATMVDKVTAAPRDDRPVAEKLLELYQQGLISRKAMLDWVDKQDNVMGEALRSVQGYKPIVEVLNRPTGFVDELGLNPDGNVPIRPDVQAARDQSRDAMMRNQPSSLAGGDGRAIAADAFGSAMADAFASELRTLSNPNGESYGAQQGRTAAERTMRMMGGYTNNSSSDTSKRTKQPEFKLPTLGGRKIIED